MDPPSSAAWPRSFAGQRSGRIVPVCCGRYASVREPSPGSVGAGRRSVVRGPLVRPMLRRPGRSDKARRVRRASLAMESKSAGAVRLRRSQIPPRDHRSRGQSQSMGRENMPPVPVRRGVRARPRTFPVRHGTGHEWVPWRRLRSGVAGCRRVRGGRQRERDNRSPGARTAVRTSGAISAAAVRNSDPGIRSRSGRTNPSAFGQNVPQ